MKIIAGVNRLDELTALRGVAAAGVVLLHASYEWNPVFNTGQRFTNIVQAGGIWVHFFFVLSGFVLTHAYVDMFSRTVGTRNYARFIWVRFGRIYPLYITTLLLWIACWKLGWIGVRDPGQSLLLSILLLQGFTYGDDVWNYPGWSISAEWVAYLIFPFVIALITRCGRQTILIIALLLSLAIITIFGIAPSISHAPIMAIVYCLIEVSLGCVIHRIAITYDIRARLAKTTASLICILPLLLVCLPPTSVTHWINGIAAVSCAATILVIACRPTYLDRLLRTKPLQFLGVISYSIYLNHAFLFRISKTVVNTVSGRVRAIETLAPGPALLTFSAYFMMLIIASWLTFQTIETPARRWFKRNSW